MKLKHFLLIGLPALSLTLSAKPVVVKMNSISTALTLSDINTGAAIEIPTPTNYEYNFELAPGVYHLTGLTKDGVVNGEIDICVTDSTTVQQFTVLTCTAYVTNKLADNTTSWSIENHDYTLNVTVNTREGVRINQIPGKSATPNRYTFLALNGNSYNVAFVPSDAHKAEGYMTLYRGGTLTANVNVSGAIPLGGDFSISVPDDAELQLGIKFTHFTDFTPIEPKSVETSNGGKTYNFTLANGQVYNYRTWKPGGLSHGGYFSMNTNDPSKCPVINFSEADYAKADPKAINHSPQSNNGYETGDILLNINPQHHLKLNNIGDEFLVHGMRMWELTDNSTNNYFFEPDFHYTILDTNFMPCSNIIDIDNADTNTSAWSSIKAKAPGTAIVLVTYDGINLNYYNNAEKRDYLGGEYWGAIWPENTGVFVVSVAEEPSSVVPNMTVNEEYNMDALRLAGNNVDAEHDVFYYLDTEVGYYFTFKPDGVASIEIASPQISENKAQYTGFTSDGVVKNDDDSYTLLLKEGRNIVRMTDASGHSVYQVLRAKPCHREITNQTRPESKIFQPGDQVKIQYSGLFHPANKIAGIYNMSAYVTYNGTPNGSSLILGSGQYTFGSAASAQAVTVEIPADYNVSEHPQLIMDQGVIQVNGYGDPIGNHRNTSSTAGRSPNFTAVPHKTYFGAIPDIKIDINPVKYFNISLSGIPEGAEVKLLHNGAELSHDDGGIYSGTYGSYSIVANADGYKCYRQNYLIGDDSEDNVVFDVEMQVLGDAWDGKTKSEPSVDADGKYLISTPAELAWFADNVNNNGGTQNAVLLSDIELGNFDWSPIGTSSKNYSGIFNGQGHAISEIYINETANHKGLFGYIKDAKIDGLTISGSISGSQYVGGLAGYVAGESTIDRCANYCNVSGLKTYVGGLVGYLYSATASITNCYNAGNVSGTTNCGGLIGCNNAAAVITNIFNVGFVEGTAVGACVGGTTAKNNLTNAYSVYQYQITANQTLVSQEQMTSGEIAYKLGDAFFQTIGEEPYPVFNGLKVYYNESTDEYYNMATDFGIEVGEGDEIVKIEDGKIIMHINDTYQLDIVAYPKAARLPEILWSSDNDVIASVDKGLVSALSKGETEIKATAIINGEPVSVSCTIIVIGAIATELLIEQTDVALDVNNNPTIVLTVKYGPEYADEPQLIWSSSDEKIVTVEQENALSAIVTAVSQGVATIKVECADNHAVYTTCEIKVDNTSSVDSIFTDGCVGEIYIFDISGITIKTNATPDFYKTLSPGLYIVKYGSTVKEVLIK